jgi:hypothetical protein
MLDRDSHKQPVAQKPPLAEWIDSTPCLVKIPDRLAASFERRGPVASVSDDARGHVRMHCASLSHKAALRSQRMLPALAREKQWYAVYPIDLGKKGCRFLHFEALYPGEQCEFVFNNGMCQTVEIMWCRRVDESCFVVGAQFVSKSQSAAAVPSPAAVSQN